MKHFKLLKSLTVGLLALALVVGVMGATKVSAADAKVKLTFTDGEYTYETDVVKDKAVEIKVEDVQKGLKKGDKGVEGEVIQYISYISTGDCTEENSVVTGKAVSFKVTPTDNMTYKVKLVPEKIKVIFTSSAPDESGTTHSFKYEKEILNGSKDKITQEEIAQGLAEYEGDKVKDTAEKTLGFEIYIADVPEGAAAISGGAFAYDFEARENYRTTNYDSTAVIIEPFYTIAYNTETDKLDIQTTATGATIYIADVKKAQGSDLKGTAFKAVTTDAEGKASFSLSDKNAGIKIDVSKTAYLYTTCRQPEDAKKKYSPNLTINGTSVKGISSITINYAKASPEITDCAIVGITYKPNGQSGSKPITVSEGDEKFAGLLDSLRYSTDGKTWYPVSGNKLETVVKFASKATTPAAVTFGAVTGKAVGTYTYTYYASIDAASEAGVKVIKTGGVGYTFYATEAAATGAGITFVNPGEFAVGYWSEGGELLSDFSDKWLGADGAVATFSGSTECSLTGAEEKCEVEFEKNSDAFTSGDTITVTATTKDFNGANLYSLIKEGASYQFRLNGTAVSADVEKSVNERCSKAKKVKIAKAPSLKAIKVDYAKGTIALKNGFDYFVSADKNLKAEDITLASWTTIYPYNKNSTTDAKTISTASYVPHAKFTNAQTDSVAFTKTKVGSTSIAEICMTVWETGDTAYIFGRKSATTKAPASAAVKNEVKKPAVAPVIKLTKEIYAQDIVSDTEGKTKIIDIENVTVTGGEKFEFCVVKAADIDKFNPVNAKWTKLGKSFKVESTKSTYTLDGATAKTSATLAAGDYILVRAQAVKGTDGKLASEYIKTTIVKTSVTIAEKPVEVYQWVPVK